jgi:beta-glucosidase/6-phospho-beta-glucosidase/beta-galactosidase
MTHSRTWSIKDNSSGDEAANSYEFYKKDVEALTEVGVSIFIVTHSYLKNIYFLHNSFNTTDFQFLGHEF